VSPRLPDPEAVHVPPPAPTQVHDNPAADEGKTAVTNAAGASLGPALDAVTVYVTDPPATTLSTPLVRVIDRSADRLIVSVSFAELFDVFGSVTPAGAATVAVFDSSPVVDALTEAVAV
jgi:hypothetical protein